MTCKEELILYWQDQVGPDSEEDKARGAAIGALHWEMMQSYERMIERVTQVQAFFKRAADNWGTFKRQVPLLKLHSNVLKMLGVRLLEEYKACKPLTSLDFYFNYEKKIQDKQAWQLKDRLTLMFQDRRWAELFYNFVADKFKKELEEWVKHWSNMQPTEDVSCEDWIKALTYRRQVFASYGRIYGSSLVYDMHLQTLAEAKNAKTDSAEWDAAKETAHQVAAEMLTAIDE